MVEMEIFFKAIILTQKNSHLQKNFLSSAIKILVYGMYDIRWKNSDGDCVK